MSPSRQQKLFKHSSLKEPTPSFILKRTHFNNKTNKTLISWSQEGGPRHSRSKIHTLSSQDIHWESGYHDAGFLKTSWPMSWKGTVGGPVSVSKVGNRGTTATILSLGSILLPYAVSTSVRAATNWAVSRDSPRSSTKRPIGWSRWSCSNADLAYLDTFKVGEEKQTLCAALSREQHAEHSR
jgi:hypothetical protein